MIEQMKQEDMMTSRSQAFSKEITLADVWKMVWMGEWQVRARLEVKKEQLGGC